MLRRSSETKKMVLGKLATWKFSEAGASSVEVNLHAGLKTHLCTEAKQVRKTCLEARYKTRACGSGNVAYMSHLKDFRVKRKEKQAQQERRPNLAC